MKRMRKNTPWYNTRDKEIGGIVMESRAAMTRYDALYPDARTGLRLLGAYPGVHTTIL